MIINYNFQNSHLIFSFILEKNFDDKREYINKSNNRIIKLNNTKCCFVLPDSLINIHPDLIALSGILLIYPFVGKRICLNFPVSKEFTDHFNKCGIEVISNEEYCSKRLIDDDTSVPSTAYSGGTDSTASLLFLPKKGIVVFMDRITVLNEKKNLYNKDNIYYALDNLIANDYNVTLVKSDMEYLRTPFGFPSDFACGVPNILLADYYNIDSIAYGYCNHHVEFLENNIDYICTGDLQYFADKENINNINNFYFWKKLFNIVSVNLNCNTMGITEISTLLLINKSPLNSIISSCLRGNIDKCCNKCFKCFKSNAVKLVMEKKTISNSDLEFLLSIISTEISKPRYNKTLEKIYEIKKIDSILLFISYFHNGNHPIGKILKNYYSQYRGKLKKLLKWNEKSTIYSFDKYNIFLKKNMNQLDNLIENELFIK